MPEKPMYSAKELIQKKRDNKKLSAPEIKWLIEGFVRGDVTDYQMSAFAMAVFFQGMRPEETTALTLAMRDSGDVMDLSSMTQCKVDKHSTGGVGDKVSICLAPMVAACGVTVPMISGRGLGHTGGTLDKLEAIPGFNVHLQKEQFVAQLAEIGCALIGQTAELAPADKRLYALRDVTATVESIPLITASILSKKLAEGIDALVMDVKVGRGAFMKNLRDARALAKSIVRVTQLAGKKVTAFLTAMDAPLGYAIGNALETAEAFRVLHGDGPDDLTECTLVLGAEMLRLAGVERSEKAARTALRATIASGVARRKMQAIIKAQNGDPRVVDEPDRLPKAPVRQSVSARHSGYLLEAPAYELGVLANHLGAGRSRADDVVDPAVGLVLHKKPGDRIEKGDTLITIHAKTSRDADLAQSEAIRLMRIAPRKPKAQTLVLDVIHGK